MGEDVYQYVIISKWKIIPVFVRKGSHTDMYQFTCRVQYDSLRGVFWVCLIGTWSATKSTDFAKRSEYGLMR